MTDTSYEEACRCPKCGKPGEVTDKSPAKNLKRGTALHTVYCRTELCRWFNTCWYVQVNPDGSVPEAKNHTGEPKLYQGFENHDQMARDIMRALEAQSDAEIRPGSEIRGKR